MKVRLLTDRACQGGYWAAGEVVDVERREAKQLIAAGQAEKVADSSVEPAQISESQS